MSGGTGELENVNDKKDKFSIQVGATTVAFGAGALIQVLKELVPILKTTPATVAAAALLVLGAVFLILITRRVRAASAKTKKELSDRLRGIEDQIHSGAAVAVMKDRAQWYRAISSALAAAPDDEPVYDATLGARSEQLPEKVKQARTQALETVTKARGRLDYHELYSSAWWKEASEAAESHGKRGTLKFVPCKGPYSFNDFLVIGSDIFLSGLEMAAGQQAVNLRITSGPVAEYFIAYFKSLERSAKEILRGKEGGMVYENGKGRAPLSKAARCSP